MALTIEEQHETNDLDHDILATREVTFICGHKRVYEDISACQKSWMERCQRCPNCQYKRDKAYVEKLSAEINSPELLEMWLKETREPHIRGHGSGRHQTVRAVLCSGRHGFRRGQSVV